MTVPLNFVNTVQADELIRTLELIHHATAPTHDDGAYHEAAHDLADEVLKKVNARRAYEASLGKQDGSKG
jgi:hypothetical protein